MSGDGGEIPNRNKFAPSTGVPNGVTTKRVCRRKRLYPAFLYGDPENLPHQISCGNSAGTPVPSPEGNIRMKNKEKPLPQKGAYLVVRNRIHTPQNFLRKFGGGPENLPHAKSLRIFRGDPCAEWALTQLLADLPHRKYFRRGPRRALS